MTERREVLRRLRVRYRPGRRFRWGGVLLEAASYPWWNGEYVLMVCYPDDRRARNLCSLWSDVARIAVELDKEAGA